MSNAHVSFRAHYIGALKYYFQGLLIEHSHLGKMHRRIMWARAKAHAFKYACCQVKRVHN